MSTSVEIVKNSPQDKILLKIDELESTRNQLILSNKEYNSNNTININKITELTNEIDKLSTTKAMYESQINQLNNEHQKKKFLHKLLWHNPII